MNTQELGKRIREARLAKKMTQSEVVGDFITRNMLSQIESGTATPSMKTLEYISRALGVPISLFMPSDDTIDALGELTLAKTALKNGNYPVVLSLTESLAPELRDEAEAMQAQAHLALAQEYANKREYASAAVQARLAAEKAQRGVYASRQIRAEALVLLDETTDVT